MLMRNLLHRFKQWRTNASRHSEAPRVVFRAVPGLARRAAQHTAAAWRRFSQTPKWNPQRRD
jgi:hypothetical protein